MNISLNRIRTILWMAILWALCMLPFVLNAQEREGDNSEGPTHEDYYYGDDWQSMDDAFERVNDPRVQQGQRNDQPPPREDPEHHR